MTKRLTPCWSQRRPPVEFMDGLSYATIVEFAEPLARRRGSAFFVRQLMKLYFTEKQVPEMSTLGESQRRVVRHGAFDLFCQEHPPARWRVRLGNGIAVGIACMVAFTISHQFLFRLLIAVVTVSVIQLFIQSFLTERLRPYFRRYIETHPDEVARAA